MGLLGGVIGGLVTVAVHAAGHYLAGDPAKFDEAGVRAAGGAVFLGGFVVGFAFGP
jgi:hypothetical protein